jgi:Spy/CpxP family protein refolding chaperone
VRPLRRQLREAREEAVAALVAEPFDRVRFQTTQSALLVADQKARDAVHQLYAQIAANMTSEERRGFAAWRQNRRKMRNLLDEPEKQVSDHPR